LLIEALCFAPASQRPSNAWAACFALENLGGRLPKTRIADIAAAPPVLAMGCCHKMWPGARSWPPEIDPVAGRGGTSNLGASTANEPAKCKCIEAAGMDHPDRPRHRAYDLIFANILKAP